MAYINGEQVLSVNFIGGTGITDQDYNPESANAQSGKAVAQAIAQVSSGEVGSKITLDVPLVADYVQGEDAYFYPSGMVNTKDLNWHRTKKINQWSNYDQEHIYGREHIVKVKTDNVIQARNGYSLKDIASNTEISSVKDCSFNVWAPPTNPDIAKNVLIIGDSYTADKKWVGHLKTDHLDALSNYKLIGGAPINQHNPVDKAETKNNGVTYSVSNDVVYLSDNGETKTATAQIIYMLETPIKAGTYTYKLQYESGIGGTEFSLGIGFYNEAGGKIGNKTVWSYNATDTVELTDTAVKVTITSKASNVLNNVAMRLEMMSAVGGQGFEATGGYTWNNYVDKPENLPSEFNGNPFWIDGELDIKGYVESKLDAGANLDYLICMLGINTRVNNAYWTTMYNQDLDTAINSIKTFAPQLFEAVHTAYPNCKILVCGYPLPPFIDGVNDSKWELLFDRAEFLHRLNQTYTEFATQYDYVRFVHISSSVDSTKAFVLDDSVLNYATYKALTKDDIHPSDIGYHQIADAVWRGFVGLINM